MALLSPFYRGGNWCKHLCALAIKRLCMALCAWVPLFSLFLSFFLWFSFTHSLVFILSLSSTSPFPSSRFHYLIKYFDLQISEDYPKGGCKNGYLRHTDSSISDYDGAHKPGCPGDQSLEEGELMNLLSPFFNEKAMLLLESRWTWGPSIALSL